MKLKEGLLYMKIITKEQKFKKKNYKEERI